MAFIRNSEANTVPVGTAFSVKHIVSGSTLADRVTEDLLSKIAGNEIPPGSQLPSEQAMAIGFGVSRTVVREAVSRLKSEGLLDSRQGRGVFVRADRSDVPFRIQIDAQNPLQSLLRVLELRLGLDPEIASLAAQRRRRDRMTAINRALADIERARKAGQDAVEEDLKFHLSIAMATENPLFPKLIQFLDQVFHSATLITRANEGRRETWAEQTRIEHKAIAQAIEARDAEGAFTSARMHIVNAASRIKAADTAFWESKAGKMAQNLDNTNLRLEPKLSRPTRP
jgi:GntR family transcriptional regulator, transcriptional repressor for pyruvate dehydrogenase complex